MEHGDLYRQIVRSFSDGIVALGLDGSIRFANPSAEQLIGARLQGRHFDEFLDEEGRRHSALHLARAAQGRFFDDEVDTMLIREDGVRQWVRLRQTGLVEGERIDGVILRLTDNHETKQLLDELTASREGLMRAERIARSGSWSWNVVEGSTTHSEGLEDLYGDNVTELLGRDRERLLSITHPEDHSRLTEALNRMLTGADPNIDIELRQRGTAGWMWVRLRALATYDEHGDYVEVSGTYQDITRARATEDQLQDLVTQNSLMQAVATAANEAATLDDVLTQAGSLVVLHDDWDRATAYIPSEDGTTLHLHPQLVDQDADPTPEVAETIAIERATAEECLRRGEPVWDDVRRLTIAFPIRLDDEVLAITVITSRPPLYRHDLIRRMVEQAADQLSLVAERERTARELAEARDRAVSASQHKSDFLATMSHEIRTPLNGIIGLNELLSVTPLSDHQRHLVSGVAVSSRSLLDLINDILDFSKIEAGHLEVESVDFEVREVLAEVGNVLAESARSRGIELRISCSPDVPDVLAGDPTRLKQVLLNLGSNAVKFTAAGSVSIRATADADDEPGTTRLRVEVVDTGMGITRAQQEHIFAPFTQADSSTTRRFGGTGLGLAISAEIVQAFEGEIGVESEPGAGATFWFTARLGTATGSTQDATLAKARAALGETRILVVDDNTQNRLILREQLGWWNVASTGAADATEALVALAAAAAEGRPYDAILLDLAMPDVDGLELAAAVRQGGYPADLPLVLLTSSYTPAGDALRSAGITACLSKPVPSSTLRELLLTVLTDRGHPETAPSGETVVGQGRLLVVEDNSINQIVARGLLESLGYDVETADDGEEALTMVGAGGYDAVLMDVQMPRLDGYAATRALRERGATTPQGGRLPIIAMTAAAVTGEREKCLAAGMDDFVTKPISASTLSAVLGEWIDGSSPDVEVDVAADDEGPVHPHLDLERLSMLRELGARPGEEETYLDRALGNFLARRPEVIAALQQALSDDDPVALGSLAHALRGSAGNLGLPVVTETAAQLEQSVREGSTVGARELLAELLRGLSEAGDALETYREWYQSLAS